MIVRAILEIEYRDKNQPVEYAKYPSLADAFKRVELLRKSENVARYTLFSPLESSIQTSSWQRDYR